jgi:transposase-like protein
MRQRELAVLLKSLEKLTRSQRQLLVAELTAGERRTASIEVIESTVADKPCCPHCAATQVVKNGSADGLQRYKCNACRKTFNALTGTPLARLRQKGKWLEQTAALRDGLSVNRAAERIGVARTTAFRWRHRFLSLPKTIQAQALVGIAETDETFFLRSFKGIRKGLSRPPRKRGGRAGKRGLSKEQVPVLVARDRSGNTADFILPADDKASVVAALGPILPKDTVLCSDGSGTLAAAAKALGVTHRPINLSAGIRVVAGVYHVQNVNSYDSRLKDWIRRFRGVATRYLDSYLGWFRTIDRTTGATLHPAPLLVMAVKR